MSEITTEFKAALETLAESVKGGMADLTKMVNARMDAVEKKVNRPPIGGGADDDDNPKAAEYKAALNTYLRRGDDRELKAMSVDSDPDGGYAVQPTLSRQIFTVLRTLNPIRQFARVVNVGSDAYEEVQDRAQAAGANWVGEREARPATGTPQLAMLRIPVREIYAQPEISQKLLDDNAFDLENWLLGKLGEQFAISEAAAFTTGSSVTKPRGFTTYPTAATADSARAWGTFQHVGTGNSGDFASSNPADVLHDVVDSLAPAYLANARWFMPRTVRTKVRKFKDTTGDYLWQRGLQAGQPDTLLGFPVAIVDDMPALGAGSLSLAFGDMQRGYTIVQRKTIGTLRDPYSNKPLVRFYTTMRVGGDVADFNAIKFVKFS